MTHFVFDDSLLEGVILSRPNRFIMEVQISGVLEKCHCPVTGAIGSLTFSDIPCLISKSSDDSSRKTAYTVEAISLDPVRTKEKKWIGINQVRANRYIEHYIKTGQLSSIVANGEDVKRESKLGNSRIDFSIGAKHYIEVKSPLAFIPSESHPNYKKNKVVPMSSDRLIKHFQELANSLSPPLKRKAEDEPPKKKKKSKKHKSKTEEKEKEEEKQEEEENIEVPNRRATVVLCFMYDAPPFRPPDMSAMDKKQKERAQYIRSEVNKASQKGVELWQVNLLLDKTGVTLDKYFKVQLQDEYKEETKE